MRQSPQLDLPFAPPARTRRGRPAAARPEDEAVHEAVMLLRRNGFKVYRSGADHKVGERLLTTAALLAVAESYR
ncbi:MAG TPA: hypothetical protein VM689_18830 [Aliidongia sp.]|nr:hypothetical protein [Aliidongia sp.]